jgi:hypothetical protein
MLHTPADSNGVIRNAESQHHLSDRRIGVRKAREQVALIDN